mgnify:CR=1 FL=1
MPPEFVFALPPAGVFAIVIGTVGVIALLLHGLFYLPRLGGLARDFAAVSPVIVTITGTIFGLSVTFLANMVWNTEDRAQETVNTEARSIAIMENYIESMTGPSRDGLYKLIEDYGHATAGEWETMTDDGASPRAERMLRDIYSAIIKGFSEGEQNRLLQSRLLAALDVLSEARQQRLSMAHNIVSVGQWALVTGLGLLLLFMVAAIHACAPKSRGPALAAVSLAIGIMLSVIVQHDRPFVGHSALTPAPILWAAGVEP